MNRVDQCQSCGRSLIYLLHARTGNVAPIEYAPAANGNVVPVDAEGDPTPIVSAAAYRIKGKHEEWDLAKGLLYLNHFASCPNAARYRPQRGAA